MTQDKDTTSHRILPGTPSQDHLALRTLPYIRQAITLHNSFDILRLHSRPINTAVVEVEEPIGDT